MSLVAGGCGGSGSAAPDDPTRTLDGYLRNLVSDGRFAGVALVAKGDRVLLNRGYGLADLASGRRNSPRTLYPIASITKTMTATAVLLLQAEHRLNLDNRICVYLARCPGAWRPITIRELLSHTAGLPEYLFLRETQGPSAPQTLAAAVHLLERQPLDFRPGTKSAYSNSGYLVAGLIIEHVSGESYGDFIREHVFRPLHMQESAVADRPPVPTRIASGYMPDPATGRLTEVRPFAHTAVLAPGGGIETTTGDLLKFARALNGSSLLPSAERKQMFTIVRDQYALGWEILRIHGRIWQEQLGGTEGWLSALERVPSAGLTIIIISNQGAPPVDRYAVDLAQLALGSRAGLLPRPPTAVEIPKALLKRYTGRYIASGFGAGTPPQMVTSHAGHLFIFGREFLPYARRRFFDRWDPRGRAIILANPSGTVTGIRILFPDAGPPALLRRAAP
ncbi:MAG: serine hydrolase domain-containing protein [Gaiellaceae bacterium]